MKNDINEKDTLIQEEDEIVTLTYDDGSQEDFYDIAELDYEGKWYIYLQPVEPSDEFAEDEVIVYEIAEDDSGEEIFLPVEDDALMQKLVDMLNEELEAK
ncbi:MAG TPA: DUF1292 domain-containing protein [Clostridia bacterium]|mgnify:CR=1 FL=1|jgi:uncharacterized protein YrzB (UPF0473 family)|nr:DUF1292 domain-containing protein [Clostridia bacterium]